MKNSLMNSKILLMFMEGTIENQRSRGNVKGSRMRKKSPDGAGQRGW